MDAKTTGWIEVVLGVLVVLVALLIGDCNSTTKFLEFIFGALVVIFGALMAVSK